MNKASKQGVVNQRAQGEAILARLADLGTPAALKAPAKAFTQAQAELEAASKKVEAARDARDEALAAVGNADDVLDAAVLALADTMVGAGLGTRLRPLASFTTFAPSALTALAYADEVREVRAIVGKISKVKPGASVAKAAAACAKAADGVERALKAMPGPQSAYAKAIGARDALLLAWQKNLGRLKKHAALAWEDDPATLKAVFAAADVLVAPVKRRPKKAATNGATPSAPN
jgi:hypothetical protein